MRMTTMGIVKLVRGTHRHPANRALHAAGLPIYAAGIAMVAGHFAGAGTDPLLGLRSGLPRSQCSFQAMR